jgi:uncharacterized protein
MKITECLSGTHEYEIITSMEQVYADIGQRQNLWKKAGAAICPEGCGECCVNFEPDILESEALYLAAWLMENNPLKADAIANETFILPVSGEKSGCILYDDNSPWHCTVYEGRCLICRLFGYSGDHGKDGKCRWKPCRFYPAEKLEQHIPPLAHRQYMENELLELFGLLPPAMSDCMEQALSLTPGCNSMQPLREILPGTIRKLKLIIAFNGNNNNDNNNGEPLSA